MVTDQQVSDALMVLYKRNAVEWGAARRADDHQAAADAWVRCDIVDVLARDYGVPLPSEVVAQNMANGIREH